MTPKEKADELVDKLYQTTPNETCFSAEFETGTIPYKAWEQAKQCALIAVDEIMNVLTVLPYGIEYLSKIDFYEGVKQEIEKL